MAPVIIRQDDHGDLVQDEDTPTDLDLQSNIVLDDVTLWEAYVAACRAQQEAPRAVQDNLRRPTRAEIEQPPAPTTDELWALACLYVAARLRATRKPDPRIVTLAEARAEAVTAEMTGSLHSKGWISHTGNGLFEVNHRGQRWLDTATREMQ